MEPRLLFNFIGFYIAKVPHGNLPQSLIRSLIINASLLLGMLTSAFMANV